MKNILVEFECQIGDYSHSNYYIFNKKKSEWGYCKEFWGITKKDSSCLKDGCFWDNQGLNAIRVGSAREISDLEAITLNKLGVA
jgi:hypothetical protein